jgi:hypothetical protein
MSCGLAYINIMLYEGNIFSEKFIENYKVFQY